ncbi:HEAT repeat domain-containing protein, partial [Streptomyces sp. SID4948]|nr:HEAT repeat domain-containing protein [Streptomyces sp. SID4948]
PTVERDQPAARCLAAVAGNEDRPTLLDAALNGPSAARAAALRHLTERRDPKRLDLIEAAADCGDERVERAAVESFERLRDNDAMNRARRWAVRTDLLGSAAARTLARHGGPQDGGLVLAALRRTVQTGGADAEGLDALVEGAGRLAAGDPGDEGRITACRAAPVLRHLYRETSSSQLRGTAARALAAADPGFGAGFAVECLWDCEESTRELAAHRAASGDVRVLTQLRRLAADPAEEAEVQTAVRGRLSSGGSAG